MKKHSYLPVLWAFLAVPLVSCLLIASDDYWTPKGMPNDDSGKMKTLEQLEPRTFISEIPYEITNSGSYYVIKPLVGSPSSNGITIKASHVRLDLCGFALLGGTGTLSGIVVPELHDNISIRNGVIANWGQFGIDATNSRDVALIEVKAFGNSYGGMYAGDNAFLERCSAYNNGTNAPMGDPPLDDGIRVGGFSTLIGCKSRFNRGAGIHTFVHSRITECTSTESKQADGIHAEDYCTIKDSTAAMNYNAGIRVANRCRVVGNTCGQNGMNNPSNDIAGILVDGNHNALDNNSAMGNDIGIKINTGKGGNWVGRNLLSQNPNGGIILQASPFNYVAPADIFGGGNFTNVNPWANFVMP